MSKKTYTVTWTEISQHHRQLDADELAALKGVTVEELEEMGADDLVDGLADDLADLDDDGFEGLTREDIEIMVGDE